MAPGGPSLGHLAAADRNIAEGEARIERQIELIEGLKMRGADTATGDALLGLLRETLIEWKRERDLIIATLDA